MISRVNKKQIIRKPKANKKRKTKLVRDIIDFAHAHKIPEGSLVGHNIILMDWQISWLIQTLDPAIRVSILSVARRAGKTALVAIIAAAALYGPLVVPNSRIISSSRSREQAALVYRYIMAMARLSGFDNQLIPRESKKQILCPRTGVTYDALSADASTAQGISANILITDELGSVRGGTDTLFDTLSSGQGSYANPKHLIISTRAPNDNDLFNMLIDDGLSGNDPTTAVTVYEADEGCDLLDEEQWLKANPSLPYGVRDLEDLRRQALQASRMPSKESSFRNLILNQKVDPDASFISASVWKQGNRSINEDLFLDPNNYVYGGLDLSARRDITALVLTVEDPETNEIHTICYAWAPSEGIIEKSATDRVPYDLWAKDGYITLVPGAAVHYDSVANDIAEIVEKYSVMEINFDRWRIVQLEYEMDKIGCYINLKPFGQGFRDFDGAVNELESVLIDDQLIHAGNPLLTNHISNVVVSTDASGARKFNKGKSISRIDAAVSLAMAVAAIKRTSGDESAGGLYGSDESAAYAVI